MKSVIIAIIATALVAAIPTAFAHRGGMKAPPQAGAEAEQEEGKEDAAKGRGKGKGKGGPGRGGKGIKGGMPVVK